MADIALDTQGTPTTPSSGVLIVYGDNGSKQVTAKNDAGRAFTIPGVKNWSTADQAIVGSASTEVYITGSSLAIPQHLMQVGTLLQWRMFVLRNSGAGLNAPTWSIRVGTAGTIADAARVSFTGVAQTAAADQGTVLITAVLRSTGAAGVLVGGLSLNHQGNTAGLANVPCLTLYQAPAGFDTTVPGLIVGVSVNPGAASITWTHQIVTAEAINV